MIHNLECVGLLPLPDDLRVDANGLTIASLPRTSHLPRQHSCADASFDVCCTSVEDVFASSMEANLFHSCMANTRMEMRCMSSTTIVLGTSQTSTQQTFKHLMHLILTRVDELRQDVRIDDDVVVEESILQIYSWATVDLLRRGSDANNTARNNTADVCCWSSCARQKLISKDDAGHGERLRKAMANSPCSVLMWIMTLRRTSSGEEHVDQHALVMLPPFTLANARLRGGLLNFRRLLHEPALHAQSSSAQDTTIIHSLLNNMSVDVVRIITVVDECVDDVGFVLWFGSKSAEMISSHSSLENEEVPPNSAHDVEIDDDDDDGAETAASAADDDHDDEESSPSTLTANHSSLVEEEQQLRLEVAELRRERDELAVDIQHRRDDLAHLDDVRVALERSVGELILHFEESVAVMEEEEALVLTQLDRSQHILHATLASSMAHQQRTLRQMVETVEQSRSPSRRLAE